MLGTLWNEKLRGRLGLSFCVPMGTRDRCSTRPSPQVSGCTFQGAQTDPLLLSPPRCPPPALTSSQISPRHHSQWGQVGDEALLGLRPAQCPQLQSLSELVAPSQPHENHVPRKLGTLSQVQRASLSHLPEAGASSVVPSCSDAPLRTRLRTVSRWEHEQIHVSLSSSCSVWFPRSSSPKSTPEINIINK